MGVDNLISVIKAHAPGAIKHVRLDYFRGMCVAIDTSLMVHQLVNVEHSRDLAGGRPSAHLQGIFSKTVTMMSYGITPWYIFDGAPPAAKAATLAARRRGPVEHYMFDEVAALLDAMGVARLQAPAEAEAQAAALNARGAADAVITNDVDALVFGANIMVKDFNTTRNSATIIDRRVMLEELGLSQAEFTDLCILLGCDYTTTIEKIGPKRAVVLIKEHRTIEAILATGVKPREGFDYELARREFRFHTVVARERPAPPAPNADEVAKWLVDREVPRVAKKLAELRALTIS